MSSTGTGGKQMGGRQKGRKWIDSGKLLSLLCFVLIIVLWCALSYSGKVEDITLIPMGAARLRITAFPPYNYNVKKNSK